MKEQVKRFLSEKGFAQYKNIDLEYHTFLEVYCRKCENALFKHDKYGRDRLNCKEPMGLVGNCDWFYPTENYEQYIISIAEKEKEVRKEMKGTLKEGIEVPEGVHTGTIESENLRENELPNGEIASYLDFKVGVDDVKDIESVKFGVPYIENPTAKSKMGQLLVKCGVDLNKGFDTEKDVVGKKIKYQTTNTPEGYARVMFESIKLV